MKTHNILIPLTPGFGLPPETIVSPEPLVYVAGYDAIYNRARTGIYRNVHRETLNEDTMVHIWQFDDRLTSGMYA